MPVRYLPQTTPDHLRGTWRDAKPARIEASLRAALRRPTHGWLVAAASADVPAGRTLLRTVAGREVVLWRDKDGSALAGPGACPHLGARLDACDVVDGTVLCRWHGMPLDGEGQPELAHLRRVRRRHPVLGARRRGRGGRRAHRPPGARHPPAAGGVPRVGHLAADRLRAARHRAEPARPVARRLAAPLRVQRPLRRRRRVHRGPARARRRLPAGPHLRGAGARRVHLPRLAHHRHDDRRRRGHRQRRRDPRDPAHRARACTPRAR